MNTTEIGSIRMKKTQNLRPQRFRISEQIKQTPVTQSPFALILRTQTLRENLPPINMKMKKQKESKDEDLQNTDPLALQLISEEGHVKKETHEKKSNLPPVMSFKHFNFNNVLINRSKIPNELKQIKQTSNDPAPINEADEERMKFQLLNTDEDPYLIYYMIMSKKAKEAQTNNLVSTKMPAINQIMILCKKDNKGMKPLCLDSNIFESLLIMAPPTNSNIGTDSSLAPGLGWSSTLPRMNPNAKFSDLSMRLSSVNSREAIENEYFLSFFKALNFEKMKNFVQAAQHYTHYLQFAEAGDDTTGPCFAFNRLSNCYFKQKEFDQSLKFAMRAMNQVDEEAVYIPIHNIGLIYRRLSYYEKSRDYFNRGVVWASSQGDLELRLIFNIQLAITEFHRGSFTKVIQILNVCLSELSEKLPSIYH